MTYSLTPVSIPSGALVKQSLGYGGFPASYATGAASLWICRPQSNNVTIVYIGGTIGGVTLNIQDTVISVSIYMASGSPIGQGSFSTYYPLSGTRSNILVSWDSVGNNMQVSVNNALLPGSVTWSASQPIQVNASQSLWGFQPQTSSISVSDYWASDTPYFYDLSDPSITELFLNILLQPVNLGAIGQLPLGGNQPAVFLSQPPSSFVANDFALNLGKGGSYQVSGGGLTFPASNQCQLPPTPFIPPLTISPLFSPIAGVCIPHCDAGYECNSHAYRITGMGLG